MLLWPYLICTLFESMSVNCNGFTETQPRNRSVRQLQATMLSNASQALRVLGVGRPPVNATIYSSSLQPGWVVKSIGRADWQQPVAGAGTSGSQAFCATLLTEDVSLLQYVFSAVFSNVHSYALRTRTVAL